MIKTVLSKISKALNKSDMKTVVVYPSDSNNLRLSCHTDDSQYYVYCESKTDGWKTQEFAFRDWSSISSVMSIFYDSRNPSSLKMDFDYNEEGYPYLIKFKNNNMKMTYYLQNYTFISRQNDILQAYKGKKFCLKHITESALEDLDGSLITQVSKLSGITAEKSFRVAKEGDNLYFYFGDESKTIDNAKLLIQSNYPKAFIDKGFSFSVDYFTSAYNALKDMNPRVRIDSNIIFITGDDEDVTITIAISGTKV